MDVANRTKNKLPRFVFIFSPAWPLMCLFALWADRSFVVPHASLARVSARCAFTPCRRAGSLELRWRRRLFASLVNEKTDKPAFNLKLPPAFTPWPSEDTRWDVDVQ